MSFSHSFIHQCLYIRISFENIYFVDIAEVFYLLLHLVLIALAVPALPTGCCATLFYLNDFKCIHDQI